MKTSWKTTLAGGVAAVGAYLTTQPDPAWLSIIGKMMSAAGVFLIGLFARDNDKSSNDVGAGS